MKNPFFTELFKIMINNNYKWYELNISLNLLFQNTHAIMNILNYYLTILKISYYIQNI
jgi:hypothetical protein